MTPEAAAFGAANGMTPSRFAQIAQMVSEVGGIGPMMDQLMRGGMPVGSDDEASWVESQD